MCCNHNKSNSMFTVIVMWKYQYRDETAIGGYNKVDQKDFKRLNKQVLREGATNAAVSVERYSLHLKLNKPFHTL